jgi:2,5-diamino-6-(ribosylamino)-4(3H)-pyrimidinone 5'-phosphate reductase
MILFFIFGENMKPYVILNAAMTLDGKIATKTGSSEISGNEDLIRVHELRKAVDGIMVGINTVMVDNPKLTAHKVSNDKKDNPIRIVVDSNVRTPLNSNVLNNQAKTIIAISNNALSSDKNTKKIEKLKKHATIFSSGDYPVDLVKLLDYLYENGIKTLMLEGGSTLIWSMFKYHLIDEIRLAIAPLVVGGLNAKTLVDGSGFNTMAEGINLELIKSYNLGKDLILEYKCCY